MSSLTSLTIPELETAAADARNAALVVYHAGWAVGMDLREDTGNVCANGAAQLATYTRIQTVGPVYVAERPPGESGSRYTNLLRLLADVIPPDLCHLCHLPGWLPVDTIVHYNDKHCPGGDVLAGLFVLAAERAQTEIANRRSMTSTGRLLATV